MRLPNPVPAAVFFLFSLMVVRAADPPDVELITTTEQMQPTSTFEVRFSTPIIPAEQVGSIPAESPLVIEPAIPGSFTWLSQRSGVFVPTEMPRLGTDYIFTIRSGLKDADGGPVGGDFRQTLATPAFGVTESQSGVYNPHDVSPGIEVKVAFNLAIPLGGAASHFRFVNSEGRSIPAKVRHATGEDWFRVTAENDDWVKRWLAGRNPSAEERDEEDPDEVFTNRLIVEPETALTPGGSWRLEIKAGLRGEPDDYALAKPVTIELGEVAPFRLQFATPTNYINTHRSVSLDFSQPLAPDITAETASRFFTITPAVANLRFEEGWSNLVVRGDFQLNTEYALEVGVDVISRDGLPFTGDRTETFTFQPVAPRLYLPGITGHQMQSGSRQFDVQSVNLESLRVVARLVKPVDAAAAIQAFKGYDRPYDTNGPEDEPYQALPPDAIPGEVISDKTIPLENSTVDERRITPIDWTQILGERKSGVIFLTVEGTPIEGIGGPAMPAGQALIQLTDLGILWKKANGNIRANVFSMQTGAPVQSANVTLLNELREPLAQADTNADGFAEVECKPGTTWLQVTAGTDVHVVNLRDASELPMFAFRVPVYYRGWDAPDSEDRPVRGLLFTDRPLYRPDETVHIKGIIREVDGNGLRIVKNRKGTLRVSNSRGDDVDEIEVETDARGSFDVDIELNDASPGGYFLRLEFPEGGYFFENFIVANFQPNAFELNVEMPARLEPRQPLDAVITANYLFGAPLTKARAVWTLRLARSGFFPDGFDLFHFGLVEEPERNVLTLRGEAEFNGADGFHIQPQIPDSTATPSRGVLTVETTDINQQTVTDVRTFARDASEFYLGLALPDRSVFRAGEEVAVRAVAVNPDGEPLAKPIDVKAELFLKRFDTVRVKGAGDAISFRTETSEESVGTAAGTTLLPTREGADWMVRDGETVKFTPEKPGQYFLRVTATDSSGNEVLSEIDLYVSGRDAIAWDYRNASQVDLVPDKADYRPGETARVLVKTPIDGEAMVTIERGDNVLRSFTAKLEGNSPILEVPIKSGDGPNVFVSMVVIRGADGSKRKYPMPEYRYGLCQLNVGDPMTKLALEVQPDRREVQPGDEVNVTLAVHDANGRPVPDAEVTFFAIDDGVVSLTGYERPKPNPIFDAPIALGVRTGLTLYDLMAEDPADLEFGNKGYLIGGGGFGGPGLKIRKDFPGTVCWMPSLKTGKDGSIAVKFTAPDALTRYRLVAVAQAGAERFGSAESAVGIRKPLMLLPAVGQFANVGDHLIARAVVRNDTGADGTVDVALKLDATAVGDGATNASIALKNGEARAVDFPVTFREMGRAEWAWSARMQGAEFTDDVVSGLMVGTPMLVLRETVLSDLGEKTNDLLTGVNPQLLEGKGSADVTVANTRLSSLGASFKYLRDYEYGCAEQTSSKLAPAIVATSLAPYVTGFDPDPDAVKDVIDRLFSMQTESGGLSFWPDGWQPMQFVSAYAAIMLTALHADQSDRPEEMDALYGYLSESLRDNNSAIVLFALALAGHPEPAYQEQAYQRRSELNREERSLLALAMLHSGGSPEAIDDLLDRRKSAPEAFELFGSGSRERAMTLMAVVERNPKSPEVAPLVKELLEARRNGRWATTQDNAWALLALGEYADRVERGGETVKGRIVLNGAETPFEVTQKSPAKSIAVTLDPAQPVKELSVANPSERPLFGESTFVVYPPVGEQPRQDRGYAVSRSYHRIGDDGELVPVENLRVGDRVVVTVRVESPLPGHFVAIDDPLPAIFEAVNFKSQAVAGAESLTTHANYQEIREDRVLYFCDYLAAGEHTFQYLARVRMAGDVMAGSTKAEEMYRPERFGLSETTRVASREP